MSLKNDDYKDNYTLYVMLCIWVITWGDATFIHEPMTVIVRDFLLGLAVTMSGLVFGQKFIDKK